MRIVIQAECTGYVYRAVRASEYTGAGYFPLIENAKEDSIYEEEWEVPETLALELCLQGTSEQVFRDGYEAWNELSTVGKRQYSGAGW